jgi:hypothetical protein
VRTAGVLADEGTEEWVKRPVLASVSRERISDERLKAVSEEVGVRGRKRRVPARRITPLVGWERNEVSSTNRSEQARNKLLRKGLRFPSGGF